MLSCLCDARPEFESGRVASWQRGRVEEYPGNNFMTPPKMLELNFVFVYFVYFVFVYKFKFGRYYFLLRKGQLTKLRNWSNNCFFC